MTALLFIIFYAAFAFFTGLKDGIKDKTQVTPHWCWHPIRISVIGMIVIAQHWHIHWLAFVGLIAFKPIFDFAWTLGNGRKERFYIGTTDWSDKLLHRIGFVRLEKTKVPIITILYSILTFVGLLCIFEALRI